MGTWTRYELGGASEEPRRALPRSDLVTRRLRASENARRRLGANGGGSEQARSTSEQTEVVRSKLGAPRSKGRWFGASSEHLGGQWRSERGLEHYIEARGVRVLVCVRVRRVRAVCGTAHRCAGDVRVRASVCVCTRARVSAVCVCAQCACVRCVCARRCAHVRLRRCADGCMCACCATARLRVLARVHAHVGVRVCMHACAFTWVCVSYVRPQSGWAPLFVTRAR